MGTNTLTTAVDNAVIPADHHNELLEALAIDHVPRNASNQATSDAGQLGSSIYRWLRGYIKEILVGTTGNNLKIHEGTAGELWAENGNNDVVKITDGGVKLLTNNLVRFEVDDTGTFVGPAADGFKIYSGAANELWIERPNNDRIKIVDGGIELITNNVTRFKVIDTGVDWTVVSDKTIPRNKIQNKNIVLGTIFNDAETSGSYSTFDSFSFDFVQGRHYMVGLIGGHVQNFDTFLGEIRITVDGNSIEEWQIQGTLGKTTIPASMLDVYEHTLADATLTVLVEGRRIDAVDDVRLVCWEI